MHAVGEQWRIGTGALNMSEWMYLMMDALHGDKQQTDNQTPYHQIALSLCAVLCCRWKSIKFESRTARNGGRVHITYDVQCCNVVALSGTENNPTRE